MKTTNILDGCLIHCGFILNHDQRLTLLQIRESTSQSNFTPTCTTLNSKYMGTPGMGTDCGCFPLQVSGHRMGTHKNKFLPKSSCYLLLHTREREYLLKVVIRRGFARSPCRPRQLLKGGKHLSKLLHAPQVVPKLPASRIFKRD